MHCTALALRYFSCSVLPFWSESHRKSTGNLYAAVVPLSCHSVTTHSTTDAAVINNSPRLPPQDTDRQLHQPTVVATGQLSRRAFSLKHSLFIVLFISQHTSLGYIQHRLLKGERARHKQTKTKRTIHI